MVFLCHAFKMMMGDYTTHMHTHTHTHMSSTHLAFGVCEIKSLQISLRYGVEDANTDDHRSHTHTHTHTLHACTLTHKQTRASDTHTYAPTQMHTWRGNPGRFISGGLQHSGCLSHFIGHRGRTGIGLFKSNPARPTHTHTHTLTYTHTHTYACIHAFSLAA